MTAESCGVAGGKATPQSLALTRAGFTLML